VDRISEPNQYALMDQSDTYQALGEIDQAVRALERAKATEGTADLVEIRLRLPNRERLIAERYGR
jgi:hypothetical protein